MAVDYTSIYSIEDHILNDIAPLYFEVNDVSLLTTGLLGMIIDTMASSIEDQFDATAKYLTEQLVSQASLPDFIYAHAASYGVTDVFATAAKMPIGLTVKESDILKHMVNKGSHYEFVIDRKLRISIDDPTGEEEMRYSIPYNIVIHTTYYKGEYSHIAFYDTSYTNDVVRGEKTKYLKMMRWKDQSDVLLYIRCDAYQYEDVITPASITTNNRLNIPYVDVSYENQLCNFEVFYTDRQGKKRQLRKLMDNQPAVTTPFVYYKILSDNMIRFMFANDDRYWIPDYNSSLEIHMFQTKGEKGNFSWGIEDILLNCAGQTDDESIAYNRKLYIDGFVISTSKGGVEQSSLETVRSDTQEKMITIDSYTTDNDLNVHFLNYTKKHRMSANFVKHRDDLAGRIYGCFSRIGNGTDIYPTNTLDLRVLTEQVDLRHNAMYQFIIKAGRVWKYEKDSLTTLVPCEKGDLEKEELTYVNLQLMVISLEANSIRLYMNSVCKTVPLMFTYMNEASLFTFMASQFRIVRDATQQDYYDLTLTITRTDGIKTVSGKTSTVLEVKPERLHVLLLFETPDGHYKELSYLSTSEDKLDYQFTGRITTDDMIDTGRIRLNNLCLRETGEETPQMIAMENPPVTIAIFYEHEEGGENGTHRFAEIEAVKEATLCNEYKPDEGELYFAYPLSLMRTHVMFEENWGSEDGYNFLLKQMPMVGAPFFVKGIGKPLDVVNAMVELHDTIRDMIPKMTQMYTSTIKFYNTYGKSRMFYLPGNSELLNRVNSDISFQVKFKDGIIPEDYLDKIQVFVKEYIERINDSFKEIGVNEVLISVLIHDIHDAFKDQIHYIVYTGFNGYGTEVQSIQVAETITGTKDATLVPEYLTIRKEDVKLTVL